jgi:hypothetical protein
MANFYEVENPLEWIHQEKNFLDFVKDESVSVSTNFKTDIDVVPDRKLKLAFYRFRTLYANFKSVLPDQTKSPNEFKLAAAICFSLRRTRPVADVRPQSPLTEAIKSGDVSKLLDAVYSSNVPVNDDIISHQFFMNFSDEIVSFEIALRVAHHLYVQRKIMANEDIDDKIHGFRMETYTPKISKDFYQDILVTMRDHTNGPFPLYLLYQSCFFNAPLTA